MERVVQCGLARARDLSGRRCLVLSQIGLSTDSLINTVSVDSHHPLGSTGPQCVSAADRRPAQRREGRVKCANPSQSRECRPCEGFVALDRAPSYVELLTCLEMAKQAGRRARWVAAEISYGPE